MDKKNSNEEYLKIYKDGSIEISLKDPNNDIPRLTKHLVKTVAKAELPVLYLRDEHDTDPDLIGKLLEAAGITNYRVIDATDVCKIVYTRARIRNENFVYLTDFKSDKK